ASVRGGVRRRRAESASAGLGVEVRCAIPGQIRRAQPTAACGRGGGRLAREQVVSVLAGALCGARLGRAQLVAKPTEREAGALRDAHDVPLTRDGVAEGMDAPARVELRLVRVSENYT